MRCCSKGTVPVMSMLKTGEEPSKSGTSLSRAERLLPAIAEEVFGVPCWDKTVGSLLLLRSL